MNDELVKIDELDEELQHKAVRDFAKFYIKLFKHENLEIIANATNGHFLIDINDLIDRNRHIDLELLVEKSSTVSFTQYIKVLEKIDQNYFVTGNAQIPWNEWETKQQEHLATA
ncbi:hypothetical protein [Paucilactobacillus kaifaensis]|uniref:hypothetical protein n=1 Tax=Paucilactobacillus kaifaensis TaxID=2559921 RepID=UPI0010F8A2A9|nr:hypothetical protein [Paucilactobacillus kaifaensis]